MAINEGNKYPTESIKPGDIYLKSLKGWSTALKLAFFPFLIAILCDIALALSARYLHSITAVYALKSLSVLIALYCVLLAFYFVHTNWIGDHSRIGSKIGTYSKRYFPALVSFVIIFVVAAVLMVVGIVLMKMLRPYAHLLGQVAPVILISIIGLLAVIWIVACFYWPFYMVRDGERFTFALRRSYAIAGLTKTVMVYLPAVAFILIFLLVNPRMPWMHYFNSIWAELAIGFVIKWILGSWALSFMCLMMNQSDFMLDELDAEEVEKSKKRAEKRAAKKAEKEAKKKEQEQKNTKE